MKMRLAAFLFGFAVNPSIYAQETTPPVKPNYGDIETQLKAEAASNTNLSREALIRLSEIRDPFQRPDIAFKIKSVQPLERYPVEEMQLLGVITGPNHVRALVKIPDGKTYIVQENAKLGNAGGFIRRITPSALFVREKVQNILIGEEEILDKELKIKMVKIGSG